MNGTDYYNYSNNRPCSAVEIPPIKRFVEFAENFIKEENSNEQLLFKEFDIMEEEVLRISDSIHGEGQGNAVVPDDVHMLYNNAVLISRGEKPTWKNGKRK